MKLKVALAAILICQLIVTKSIYAQLGKDGARIISGAITNSNEYTTLTADAAAGDVSITVASCALNSGGNFSAPLGAGDLVMIIQIQGATLNAATDSTWGAVLNYNNCGNYEFAEVQSTAGSTTINITCGLANNYTDTGRVQVIRVPRYSSLTINSGGVVSCPAWNGATGGVLTIEVSGNTVINSGGSINVSGTGFRGGQELADVANYGVGNYVWPTPNYGSQKGEGVGGYENDYVIFGGPWCKGAGANGGGGGNAHNGGGGGGANGGNPVAWSGLGNPDTSITSWKTAWNLEYNGFAYSSSSGGGKGGYTFSGIKNNPLVVPPNNPAWGGDDRDNNGGLGGRPLDYTTGKIFLGGGGGCGNQDEDAGGAGSSGGGLVYLMNYGTISGAGQVIANGTNGNNTGNYELDGGIDGAGGAGAGGTIIINSTEAITGISATANGGIGGNQTVSLVFDGNEAEGPGGGGSGGYIATSNGSIMLTANGGANGTTNSNGVAGFPANGATKGANGTTNGSISNFALSVNNPTICYNTNAVIGVTVNGILPAGTTIYWFDSPFGSNTLSSGADFTTPVLTTTTTYYVGACPGTYRIPVTVTVDSVAANFTFSNVCIGTVSSFNSSNSYSSGSINQWNWNFGDGSGTSSEPDPSYQYSSGGKFSVSLTVKDSAGCSSTTSDTVNVGTAPAIGFDAVKATGCDSLAVQFTNSTTNGLTYHWNFGDGDSSSQQAALHNYISQGIYTVILTSSSSGGCASADTIVNMITVGKTPAADFNFLSSCSSFTVQFTDASTGSPTAWSWNFGDGSGTASNQNTSHTYASDSNYNVTLIVSGTYGCSDTVSKNISVSAIPNVSFSAVSTSGCDSLPVQFTNSTTNGSTYHWNFGDGDTSSQKTPFHSYVSPGTYTVILTASNNGCSTSDTMNNLITIYKTPVAAFSYVADCASRSIQLEDSSTGIISSWSWNFGDGIGYSNQQNPLYEYNADSTYTITLIVSGGGSCTDTLAKPVTFTAPPNVSFKANNITGCDSVTVSFQNNSTNAVSYSWDFGDGYSSTDTNPVHFYAKPGIYNVTLTAVSPGGCTVAQDVINMITIDSVPQVPLVNQYGDSLVSSTTAATYQWYYNSAPINGATKQVYIATKNGDYYVVVTNSDGCTSTSAINHIVVNDVAESEIDNIAFYPNPVSDNLEINFGSLSKTLLKAELTDVLGQLVWNKNIDSSTKSVTIDMSNMSKNVYFLTFYYGTKKTVSKIIKE